MQYIPGGLGAIFFALSPLWMVLLAWVMYGERPRKRALAGVILGFAGIMFILSPASGARMPAWPAAVAFLSSLTWSYGSIVERRFKKSDVVAASAMQLLVAGTELAAVSLVMHEAIVPSAWTAPSLFSLAYLVVFGSIVAYSAYLWLMRHVRTAIASTYSYVNPIVAIAFGMTFLGERMTPAAFLGAGAVVAGVSLMVMAPPSITVAEPAEVG